MSPSEPARSSELRLLGEGEPLPAKAFGLKAAWLDRALRSGENVPPGLALSAQCLSALAAGAAGAQAELTRALLALRDRAPAPSYAVRSSPNLSLPGALATELGVADDVAAILRALQGVHASAERPHVAAQLAARAEPGAALAGAPWIGALIQPELRFPAAGDLGAVVLSHDPRTGEPGLRGEYAAGGPGAVVSGRARPLPLVASGPSLARDQPEALAAIEALTARLLQLFDRPLELELGWSAGQLFLLQVRALTLTPRALVRVALAAIEADSPGYALPLEQLAQRGLGAFTEAHFEEEALRASPPVARGVPASPGAAVGVVVTDISRALDRAAQDPIVLVRPDAVPEDVAAFRAAAAVVTSSGGLTCHAAVIARGLALPAVVGVAGVRVDVPRGVLYGGRDTREALLKEGDWVSVDARRGTVHRGRLALSAQLRDADLRRLFTELRKLRPTPLWVSGEASEALRLKDDACLDGALCAWPAQGELPAAQGRECWVEIDAARVEMHLPTLPRGWGVVVAGDLSAVRLAELRALAPLRALGARLVTPDATLPEGNWDLLVVEARGSEHQRDIDLAGDLPPQNRGSAPRLLQVMNFPERSPVPSGNNVGWLCPASHVALSALRYAALRANRKAISLADLGEP
jgi:pyruvate,orthophosphate dikinase